MKDQVIPVSQHRWTPWVDFWEGPHGLTMDTRDSKQRIRSWLFWGAQTQQFLKKQNLGIRSDWIITVSLFYILCQDHFESIHYLFNLFLKISLICLNISVHTEGLGRTSAQYLRYYTEWFFCNSLRNILKMNNTNENRPWPNGFTVQYHQIFKNSNSSKTLLKVWRAEGISKLIIWDQHYLDTKIQQENNKRKL